MVFESGRVPGDNAAARGNRGPPAQLRMIPRRLSASSNNSGQLMTSIRLFYRAGPGGRGSMGRTLCPPAAPANRFAAPYAQRAAGDLRFRCPVRRGSPPPTNRPRNGRTAPFCPRTKQDYPRSPTKPCAFRRMTERMPHRHQFIHTLLFIVAAGKEVWRLRIYPAGPKRPLLTCATGLPRPLH